MQQAQHVPHVTHSTFQPPKGPSLYGRTKLAANAWDEFMWVSREAAQRPSPLSGALRLTHLAQVLNHLIKDEALRERVLNDYEQQMRDELPPEQGKLFSMRGK